MKKPGRSRKTTRESTKTGPHGKGGESLEAIYEQLKNILAQHAPPFKLSNGGVRGKFSVQLVVPKPVAIPGSYGGKPVDLQMAAAILQKGYVGLYLMCVYMNDEVKRKLSPDLLKLCKRPIPLSITHKFRSDGEAQLDISQARQASPDHTISGRRIPGTRQVSTQLGELDEVSGKRMLLWLSRSVALH